jgi:hypothetical protein
VTDQTTGYVKTSKSSNPEIPPSSGSQATSLNPVANKETGTNSGGTTRVTLMISPGVFRSLPHQETMRSLGGLALSAATTTRVPFAHKASSKPTGKLRQTAPVHTTIGITGSTMTDHLHFAGRDERAARMGQAATRTGWWVTDPVTPISIPVRFSISGWKHQLAEAQTRSRFTFVQLHHVPYSTGPHGFPPGTGTGFDNQSGQPVRVLTPLFAK